MKIAVIIPAAGVGKRFAESHDGVAGMGTRGKLEIDLASRPVFMRAVELFVNRPSVNQIILAVNPDAVADFKFRWGDKLGFHGVKIVAGGKAERWETVFKALSVVDDSCTHVAVHDAARPLTSSGLIDRVFEAAQQYSAVIPAVPVRATLKQVEDAPAQQETEDPLDAILGDAGKTPVSVRRIVKTVDRSGLVEAQTPQVFEVELLRSAYDRIAQKQIDTSSITDDAGLVEATGEVVYVINGETTNLKITRPEDVQIAAAIVAGREQRQAVSLGRKRLFADEDD